ncbi:MAG: universal stress protein [Deltaproteobacteria bacterium]|nr:MAG: universal stress protein [Deltaproteobacteria bacterium]
MEMEEKILFGVDHSESARQAVTAAGALLKDREGCRITLFYGAPDPHIPSLYKMFRHTPAAVEECRKVLNLQEHRVLEKAEAALIGSGFDAVRVTIRGEGKCHDPADALLKLAAAGDSDTIGLARSSTSRLERMLLGSVTYRLVHCADEKAIWVIDPSIASHDVLVALGGAAVGRRLLEHVVRYFAHLRESRFTFFHVVPPLPPQYWDNARILSALERKARQEEIACWIKENADKVREIADEGKERLVKAGVREENVSFKVQTVERGMVRDILAELAEGHYGILVMGRRDSRKKGPFRLSSKANKLLHTGHDAMICLVN